MTAEERMTRALRIVIVSGLVVFLAVVALVWFSVSRALAHDHNNPELNDWLATLHSKGMVWCCKGDDTDAIEEWEAKGSHYRVKFRGEWFDVPESAVVGEPNKSGNALLWMNKGYSGYSVRCFMPGTLS